MVFSFGQLHAAGGSEDCHPLFSHMETKFESEVKHLNYSQQQVYAKLSDFSHLQAIKEQMDDERLKSVEFESDTISFDIAPVGAICLRVVEREEPKCVKMQTEQSPLPFTFWIQLLPTSDTTSKMKLTLGADLNPFVRTMVAGKLKEALDKMADTLASINYE